MTLVGCSLIWLAVVVLILAFWIPWLAWGIVPVFAVFLLMQALRGYCRRIRLAAMRRGAKDAPSPRSAARRG